MIRVGFVLEGYNWLGGINYYRSLLSALVLIPDRKIHLIIFVGTEVPEDIVRNFYCVEIVRSKVLDSHTPLSLLRRAIRKFSGQRDLILNRLLEKHNVDVLSHYSGTLPRRTRIKTIGWIPDFQYLHLPELFTENDRALREESIARLTANCHCILLSSETAQRDLAKVSPESLNKSRVLRFVPEVDEAPDSLVSLCDLELKYGFHAPYFYLPNQFWVHKNHKSVIEAVALLKKRGVHVTVLASGDTHDHRFPDYYNHLMALVECAGVKESFKVLGVIPYNDLLSLVRNSMAVINPSLFEGWSTTVEEAKALNKTILLSDLPVHKEQNPSKGIFFDPLNSEDLTEKMFYVMRNCEGRAETSNDLTYLSSYHEDRLKFALCYQDIVVQLYATSCVDDTQPLRCY